MAGASFKFLRIFASYCTDSENWVSYLDDCFFFMNIFSEKFEIQRLSLESLCWHFSIYCLMMSYFLLFPELNVFIDSGLKVAVELCVPGTVSSVTKKQNK